MSKRAALLSAMLLAGVVVAVVGATAALRFIGGDAFGPGGQALTPADVQRSLAQYPPAPSPRRSSAAQVTHHPTAPRTRTPAAPAPVPGSFTSSGGTVNASCLSGQVRLTSWIPAQGYQTDGYARGPSTASWVVFRSSATDLTITATCAGGNPRFTTAADDRAGRGEDRPGGEDRHGGGGPGGGGGGSGGGGSGHGGN